MMPSLSMTPAWMGVDDNERDCVETMESNNVKVGCLEG